MADTSRTTMNVTNMMTMTVTLIMYIHFKKEAVDIIIISHAIHIYCKIWNVSTAMYEESNVGKTQKTRMT